MSTAYTPRWVRCRRPPATRSDTAARLRPRSSICHSATRPCWRPASSANARSLGVLFICPALPNEKTTPPPCRRFFRHPLRRDQTRVSQLAQRPRRTASRSRASCGFRRRANRGFRRSRQPRFAVALARACSFEPGALDHRQARVLGVARVGLRALAHGEAAAASVADHPLMAAAAAEARPRRRRCGHSARASPRRAFRAGRPYLMNSISA